MVSGPEDYQEREQAEAVVTGEEVLLIMSGGGGCGGRESGAYPGSFKARSHGGEGKGWKWAGSEWGTCSASAVTSMIGGPSCTCSPHAGALKMASFL